MTREVPRSAVRHNLIVASLPDSERLRVVRHMEPVDLPVRMELAGHNAEPVVWFPNSGLASIVSEMSDGSVVECAAVGMEGWIGRELFAQPMPAGMMAFQQIAGSGLRMSAEAFQTALSEAPAFAAAVSRFTAVMLSYALQTAACNRLHDAIARCARWLLFTRERIGRDDLAITHEFLGQMLGASRSGVTATLARLEDQHLIERSRGRVIVRDAQGLGEVACECHGVLLDVYERYTAALRQ
jgi:CRP-like cAMP-binding protein